MEGRLHAFPPNSVSSPTTILFISSPSHPDSGQLTYHTRISSPHVHMYFIMPSKEESYITISIDCLAPFLYPTTLYPTTLSIFHRAFSTLYTLLLPSKPLRPISLSPLIADPLRWFWYSVRISYRFIFIYCRRLFLVRWMCELGGRILLGSTTMLFWFAESLRLNGLEWSTWLKHRVDARRQMYDWISPWRLAARAWSIQNHLDPVLGMIPDWIPWLSYTGWNIGRWRLAIMAESTYRIWLAVIVKVGVIQKFYWSSNRQQRQSFDICKEWLPGYKNTCNIPRTLLGLLSLSPPDVDSPYSSEATMLLLIVRK